MPLRAKWLIGILYVAVVAIVMEGAAYAVKSQGCWEFWRLG